MANISINKILITGANGQLGRDLIHVLTTRGHEVIGTDLQENYSGSEKIKYACLDITNYENVKSVFENYKPDRVIHCAAWTAVDAAEDEANKKIVWSVNALGTENIARVCNALDIVMTYISTDYVFHGNGSEPWKPEDEGYEPLNYYGLSKLEGEHAIRRNLKKFFIVRIAWAFGAHGNNFVKIMLNLAK